MKGFQRNVGNYSSAFKGLAGSVGSLMGAFGVTGGLFMFAKVIKSSFNVIKDFDKAMKGLQAITNGTESEMTALRNSALKLGATTPRTAAEVAGLQTELAKLGFTSREIIDTTESVIALSIATGSDLARAADIAGSTLRGFGLDAKESQRVVDVMAKGFSTSALAIDNFSESMKYVAPVATQAGFTIEETTAMLAKLADAGIRGSMAGTSLRMIMLKMAQAGLTGMDGFNKMAKSGITLAEANDEVGQRAQTALLILSKQKDEVAKLTEVYNNAQGAVQEMADIMADNLAGDVDKATSAWEGLILSFDNGGGVITKVSRKLVQLWTGLLEFLKLYNTDLDDLSKSLFNEEMAKSYAKDIEEYEKIGKKHVENIEAEIEGHNKKISELSVERRNETKKEGKADLDKLNQLYKLTEREQNAVKLKNDRIQKLNDYIADKEEKQRVKDKEARDKALNDAKKAAEEQARIAKDLANQKAIADKGYLDDKKRYLAFEDKMTKEANSEALQEYKDLQQEQLNALTQRFINGKISAKAYADELLTIQITSLEEQLQYAKDNGLDILAYETQLLALKKQLKDQETEHFVKSEETKRLSSMETLQQLGKIFTESTNLFAALNDSQLQQLEEKKNYELELAGESALGKKAAEQSYAKEVAKIKRKQAIADKTASLFNIALDTAQGVLQYGKNPLTAPLIPFVIALGAVQAATVLATPIPKFYKGVRNFEGGMALVGEQGAEIYRTPDNQLGITPNQATLMALPRGTDVYTHSESKQMMAANNIDISELVMEQRKTRQAIASKSEYHTHLDKDGLKVLLRKGNNSITYADKYLRF
jgi:hypothetical protein